MLLIGAAVTQQDEENLWHCCCAVVVVGGAGNCSCSDTEQTVRGAAWWLGNFMFCLRQINIYWKNVKWVATNYNCTVTDPPPAAAGRAWWRHGPLRGRGRDLPVPRRAGELWLVAAHPRASLWLVQVGAAVKLNCCPGHKCVFVDSSFSCAADRSDNQHHKYNI